MKGEQVKIRRPSPSMAVACTALFVALGGTSVAAVSFARNAGAVDGRSAVPASSSVKRAAGKLVATASAGPDKGRIPARFLAGPRATPIASYVAVTDGQTGAPSTLATITGFGTLTATCADQSPKPGIEDPVSTITLTSATTLNLEKRLGVQPAEVLVQGPGTIQTITISGSNTFEMHMQTGAADILVEGVVRQDGRGSGDAHCLVHGMVIRANV